MRSAAAASARHRTRLGYTFSRPVLNNKHQLRLGADFRHDLSTSEVNSNARGRPVHGPLYKRRRAGVDRHRTDFADFLLGLPQKASLQVGGQSALRQNSWDVYPTTTGSEQPDDAQPGLRYDWRCPTRKSTDRWPTLT